MSLRHHWLVLAVVCGISIDASAGGRHDVRLEAAAFVKAVIAGDEAAARRRVQPHREIRKLFAVDAKTYEQNVERLLAGGNGDGATFREISIEEVS